MKGLLEFKEAEIEELRARNHKLKMSGGNSSDGQSVVESNKENIALMTQALREREEQIEDLQDKVKLAAKELESSALLIEDLTRGSKPGADPVQKSLMEVRGQLKRAETRIQELEEDKKDAEENARLKSEELSETIAKIRAYEKGEYGLENAVEEVKQTKRQLKHREIKLEELTQTCNNLQYQNGELAEENAALKDKLGLEVPSSTIVKGRRQSDVRINGSCSKRQQERALMQVMQREIERLEEERIQLKTENRKLARQLGHSAAQLGLDAEDLKAVQEYRDALRERRRTLTISSRGGESEIEAVIGHHETVRQMQTDLEKGKAEIDRLQQQVVETESKIEDLMEENDSLRKGMEEILDSVREQDGKSDVTIKSPTLDKLLSILDARHLWGNYHPAMGLKAKIEKLDGANEGKDKGIISQFFKEISTNIFI